MSSPIVLVRREGPEVTIVCRCTDAYAAIKLYEEMLRQSARGVIAVGLSQKT